MIAVVRLARTRRALPVLVLVSWALASGAAVSCGSSTTQGDAGDASQADVPDVTVDGQCIAMDAGVTPFPAVVLDGGVSLDELSMAMATIQCEYYARCDNLTGYLLNQCIQFLASPSGYWNEGECSQISVGLVCQSASKRALLSSQFASVKAAVEAGVLTYDPMAAAACLGALQTEGCTGEDINFPSGCLLTNPLFSCSDAGASSDAGADAGPTCGELAQDWLGGGLLDPCTTNTDCAATPGMPYCFSGYCFARPCGNFDEGDIIIDKFYVDDGGCPPPFRNSGESCDSDFRTGGSSPTWTAAVQSGPTAPCAPGANLVCVGATASQQGVCQVGGSEGETCQSDASTCQAGLVCNGCTCQIPPTTGPCFDNGFCQIGVAYCNNENQCTPVGGVGAPCSSGDGFGFLCAPNLDCNNSTCQQPQ
jgi:hypothetical protein